MRAVWLIPVIVSILITGLLGSQEADADSMTFTMDTSITLPSVISSGETWTIKPGVTVTIEEVGHITNSGTIIIEAGGTLLGDPRTITNQAGGKIDNFGEIKLRTLGGRLNNSGTITIKNGGVITLSTQSTVENLNGGIINIDSGGRITLGGASGTSSFLLNNAGSTINNSGRIFVSGGTLTAVMLNSGIINNNAGGEITNNSLFENKIGGIINNNAGALLRISADILTISGGTINNSGEISITGFSNPIVTKFGKISMTDGILNNLSGGIINNGFIGEIDIGTDATVNNAGTINNKIHPINPLFSGDIDNNGVINNECTGVITGKPIDFNQPVNVCDADSDGFFDASKGFGGTDCDDSNAAINTDATEVCDGIDNNCDGTIDSFQQSCYSGPDGTEGVGVCQSGTQTCTNGVFGACSGEIIPTPDNVCDSIDNDCDGIADDDFVSESTTCGVGACSSNTGSTICQSGSIANTCDPLAGASSETCDTIDNDCDGFIDESDVDTSLSLTVTCSLPFSGIGECTDGTQTCTDGTFGECLGAILPVPETCENQGQDNDCDGTDDNVEGLNDSCSVGVGQCQADGFLVCTETGLSCGAEAGQPVAETCNELDDDCDGTVDSFQQSCYTGPAGTEGVGECRSGTQTCDVGSFDACTDVTPSDEVCDGLDNNCNGEIDEGNVCVIPVSIDIKPGSDPNSVNCKSKGNVPVAILSDENFDAIDIEIVSMSLVSSSPIQVTDVHNQLHLEDVNDDGLLDGVLHIKTSDICLFIPDGTPIRTSIQITFTGTTTDGQAFEGSDNIVLKGKKILEN